MFRRAFWLNLAGACVIAIVAAVPVLMSSVMQRGFEIAKQSLFEPLAVLALGAVLLAIGWKWIMQQGTATKIAAGSLAAFLLLAVVSTGLSENPEVAIFGGYYRREGLLAWCAYGAFFFAVLGWAQRTGRVQSFLDVLLLSSVIAAAYALQQRLDLDFYPLGMRDFTRPGGTLGSPLFLAAYLAILLPVTVTRCWQARRALSELVPWLVVAALQVCGILITQSRGPLLAALAGMLLLAGCSAGRAHARRVVALVFVIFAFIVSLLIAINTLEAARHWAQDVPVISRLVFNLDRDAGGQTQRASRSAASRLAIWGAGIETFSAAPRGRKLLGYGPESAYIHYFSYMPAAVMRLIGYGQDNTFDRMHADTLDIGLNFGLLAWLVYGLFFGAVMYAAAQALWGLSGSAPPRIFFAFMCGGGIFSAVAAVQSGFAAAAVPAFGLGIGAGWFLFMIGCAWRVLKHDMPETSAMQMSNRFLIAGLTSSLWIFWMDAQVNIPVPTTRLISLGIAALILVIADGLVRGAENDANSATVSAAGLRAWGVACSLVAALASWLPLVRFDAGTGVPEMHWWRRALPMFSFLLVAGFAAWGNARRSGGVSNGAGRAWLAITVGLPLIYTAGHLALMGRRGAELTVNHAWSISIASCAGVLFIFAMCVASAWLPGRAAALTTNAPVISRAARWSIWVVAATALLVAAFDWRARQADVASTLASHVSLRQPQLSQQLIEEAIRLRPYERQYRRQLVFDLLARAVADIHELDAAPLRNAQTAERIGAMVSNLVAAESAARAAVLLFPRDPWVEVALANVLQIEALRALRPLDPDGGMRAAREANELFARTHRMFPAEPLLLRNWAQLLADQGNLAEAYRLLDIMENLIPGDPEPYSTRIGVAKLASDHKTIAETLARARLALEPALFSQLMAVAKVQQH